jgi:hypothetical protein
MLTVSQLLNMSYGDNFVQVQQIRDLASMYCSKAC